MLSRLRRVVHRVLCCFRPVFLTRRTHQACRYVVYIAWDASASLPHSCARPPVPFHALPCPSRPIVTLGFVSAFRIHEHLIAIKTYLRRPAHPAATIAAAGSRRVTPRQRRRVYQCVDANVPACQACRSPLCKHRPSPAQPLPSPFDRPCCPSFQAAPVAAQRPPV